MNKYFSKYLLQHSKTIHRLLISLVIIFTLFSTYMWLQPTNNSTNGNENDVKIMMNFDYQAFYKESILYPDGGTVEPGETMFRRIINEIPIHLTSTILSESPVQAEGTHDVKLVIQAGEYWEREFQLEDKQTFKEDGNEINLFQDGNYPINYGMIENFIMDVEEEISIRPEFYSILIYPNVEGTLTYNGVTHDFHLQDPLTLQLYSEEIVLASEQQFTTPLPFITTEVTTNTFNLFGLQIPMIVMQLTSTIITLLCILVSISMKKKVNSPNQVTTSLESEKIFQKYKKRLFPVLHNIDPGVDTIIHLTSFSHILQIADTKDIPILYYDDSNGYYKLYFVIDEGYLYQFKLMENDNVLNYKLVKQTEKMKKDSDPTYVLDQ